MTAAVELFRPVQPSPSQSPEHFDVVVIGGGQAGLSVGYHLAKKGVRFVILDGNDRVGDSWRKRWDSLRLFTPARLDSLVGMPFPAAADYFPTRDEMADYLEAYAQRFELPIRTGTTVHSLSKRDGHFLLKTNRGVLQAEQVVVAMASYQKPRVPELTFALDSEIVQLHSSAYKNPEQLREGPVLIAGAGNSGAEIGFELAKRGHRVFMSGRDTGEVPFKMTSFWGRWLLGPLVLRVVFHRLLTIKTAMGRKARAKMLHGGGPLIRTRHSDLRALGVERIPRVVGTKDGLPLLEDGSVIDVKNVVWCTGFHPGFSWIDLPVFDEQGEPKHEGGVASEPGLYFVGLHFLYSFSSTMIHGVGRDAARIVQTLVTRKALV
jgi:putative flavoprotein involved in K+ transport